MPAVSLVAELVLSLCVTVTFGNTEVKLAGQTNFVVNETSTSVIRLVIERTGPPANVTALLLLQGEDTGDFEATSAAARLLTTETNKTVYVAVKDDGLPEADETFIFYLRLQGSSTDVMLGIPNIATVTILSNDNAFGIISFNMSSIIVVNEARGRNQIVPLSLLRKKGTYGTVTVYFEVMTGSNSADEDINPARGNIILPPGKAALVYNLFIVDDQIPENDEIFTVELLSVEGGAEINDTQSSVQLKINKNDSPVHLAQAMYTVSETADVITIPVIRGKDQEGKIIGSDDALVSINYETVTGNSSASALLQSDFIDLQPNRTIIFPPYVYEVLLKFQIINDTIPEIAESFQVVLLEDTIKGDAVLLTPNTVQIIIEPNDTPHGVLSISSNFPGQKVVFNEDMTTRFDGITIVRNGGTHGNVSVNWLISRNSSDFSAITADLMPISGTLSLLEGQMLATVTLTIINDNFPEEAEAYLFQLLNNTVKGGAELDEPTQIIFYIQDSDDVYGLIKFHSMDEQKIESSPTGRFLSLSFARHNGTIGIVKLNYTVLYIPAGVMDLSKAKDDILNVSTKNSIIFMAGQSQIRIKLPIRNDAFLQNGARFFVQLETVELVNKVPLVTSVSPKLGEPLNISRTITPDLANGEVGFTSNETLLVYEPENSSDSQIYIALQRDGTDGSAEVYWHLKPTGVNHHSITNDDLGPINGSVIFLSGQSNATINITIKADDLPEINETLIISLDRTNSENQILKSGFTSRKIIILQNDDPGGVFEFSPQTRGPYFVNEGIAFELKIVRYRGTLLKQFLRYVVEPKTSFEFYGNTGVLEFDPGEREIAITLLAREDNVPELDEQYSAIISSHSFPPSKLGTATQINITVLKNDDPHGVIQFITQEFTKTINESKGDTIYRASFPVIRDRGVFGNVSVFWIVDPAFTNDVYPVQGVVNFNSAESSKNITLQSLPDAIPEEVQTFTIILCNTSGGARLGSILNATLLINKNDDPIYFEDPIILRVQEGSVANFTVVRNGSTDMVVAVVYDVENGGASSTEGDFLSPGENNTLVFEVGERAKTVFVAINEDDIPETDEIFYIVLLHSTGDTVVYGTSRATVIIEANDDPHGIFSLEPFEKNVFEGMANNFTIIRQRGKFGNVSVSWQLFSNDSLLEPGEEFLETTGMVLFTTGEHARPITLYALADGTPEFSEMYVLRLLNVSGGSPGSGAKLSNGSLSTNVVIPFNDDPFGVFVLDLESQDREVAEDILSVDDMSHITNFTILRQKGTFGDVQIGWEILSSAFRHGLPEMTDFLLVGTFPNSVELRPHSRRHHTGTDALYFSGAEGVYGTINPEYHPRINNTLANFTLSAWVMPNLYTDGFIISKTNINGSIYYAVKVMTNESSVSLMFHYSVLGSNTTHVATVTALNQIEEKTWIHIIIMVYDGIIEFYLDGTQLPPGVKRLKGEIIADGPGVLTVGADADGMNRFAGLMQDVRLYGCKLNRAEIHEIHATPAKADLHPISGYLDYRHGEKKKSFIVAARDDSEEEGEETFILKVTTVHGGARISQDNTIATLRVQKSDNANGLFGFTGTCIPQTSEEGSTISCVVERTRGSLDYVYVNYTISQIESDDSNISDLVNSTGTITFEPWQSSEVLNVHIVDDDLPELAEHFIVSLVSAISGDGKTGSTPTSGASIDPEKASTEITVKSSDHPNGLLQFSTQLPPDGDTIIPPALSVPSIRVKEEVGLLRLLVVRAQGLLGNILVAYQTVPLTASSPSDYQETSGILDFKPGEQYKYITVNITDDLVPELPNSFKVVLLNSEREVAELFGIGTSGSGDGAMDFFLPAFHLRASLGIASEIIVIIEASDDAYGVFQFSNDSLYMNGTEPREGLEIVILQVERTGGTLSLATLFWDVVSDPYNDLVNNHGNVTFKVGQSLASIELQVASDEVPELDEEFMIYISNFSHGRLGTLTNATLTVLANDDPYGVFVFAERSRPVRVEEENQNVTLTIERLSGFMGIAIVTYSTVDDTASANLPYFLTRATKEIDYLAISGSIIFEANQTEANVMIQIMDDTEPERPESVFVWLDAVTLLKGEQDRPIVGSPRLGQKDDIMAHVIINANDDAFGTLQLSTSTVRVSENYVGPIINVTRTGGIFADVSVKFQALSMTARAGEDYSIASSDVLLLEGETSKAVPIYLLNDRIPELEESFRIELINETTGGAVLGAVTQATITIEASDDPYGTFAFERTEFIVEEPESETTKINLSVVRNAGTVGTVTVQWVAMTNDQQVTNDLEVALGEVTFTPGQTIQNLQLELRADDFPEIEETIQVKLTSSTYGSSIGRNNVVNIIVPANDNPHGTVHFTQTVYRVQEPLEGNSKINVTVKRSGGHFGKLRIFYSTSKIDFVDLLVKDGQDIFSYYEPPTTGFVNGQPILQENVSLTRDAFHTCASICLKEETCSAFSFTNFSGIAQCSWVASLPNILTNSTEFITYRKNSSSVSALLSAQATAGSDYEPVTGLWASMHDGEEFANLSVTILTDSIPEGDEKFAVLLLNVELLNGMVIPANQPTIGQPNISTIVIAMNGDAFGIFLIYSTHPNATDKGSYLEVMEATQTTVQLVIDRSGGSLGEVTVEWSVVGGTATTNIDFIGDGEILTFGEGEDRRLITLNIVDDEEPEDNETILVRLTHTEGGSRILPSSDTVTVVILANDYVAGVISFHASSRSVIGHEGESLLLWIKRSSPGKGNVTVDWNIHGKHAQEEFSDMNGTLSLSDGFLNASFLVHLLDDMIPEEKEEYRIILSNIRTQGVPSTGAAIIDNQGYKAILIVEASDEPHGIVKFALSSQTVSIEEGNKTIQLFISREFGSLGTINVTFETVEGSLQPLNLIEKSLAEPGLDFLPVSDFVIMEEGEASTVINITILEDDIPELQEFFLVNLTSVELLLHDLTSFPPRLDAAGQVSQITIDANDGIKGIIQWHSINFEVNETTDNLTLLIHRGGGAHGNVSLFYYIQNLEAQLGQDFNVTPMRIFFTDGERYKSIEVAILDDNIPEDDEAFQLILTNPSFGLELGERTIVTVTIFANDDGHGILSFNNTEHFFLKEPTAIGLSESVATLHIVRNPLLGTFGMVTVQYIVTSVNGSDSSLDLKPTHGFTLFEDGERMKILQISAILDEEAEMDEQFLVTLYDPAGGARLGERVQNLITILQNEAPLGLFSIFPIENRTRSVHLEESNSTLYLIVSRSNGLENRVTVEWKTQSRTALGLKGDIELLSTLQSFPELFGQGWCFLTLNNSLFGLFLRTSGSSSSADILSTLYQWQGIFVPVQKFKTWNPTSCTTFIKNDVSYIIITDSGITGMKASNNSIYRFTLQSKLTLIQSLTVSETSDVQHFTWDNQDYLIISSQADTQDSNSKIYRWTGHLFIPHQNLPTHGATGLTLFNRGNHLYLAVSQSSYNQVSVFYQWSDDQFKKLQNLMVQGATHVSSMTVGADVYFVFCNTTIGGNHSSCLVYIWETGQLALKLVQMIPVQTVSSIFLFIPSSDFVHLLLTGENRSLLYKWNSATSQFTSVLELPAANYMVPVTVPSFNGTKTLIASAGDLESWVYELVSVSNQSDFIPGSGELIFEPGDKDAVIAISILDDDIPEDDETFAVRLTNAKGGAEIGSNDQVTIVIQSNDDAHGIIGFVQSSLSKQAEELEQNNEVTLSIERLRGTQKVVTVQWTVSGHINDIFPTSGVFTFAEGQALTTISLTVLADNVPEVAEIVTITLMNVTTMDVQEQAKGATIDLNKRNAVLTILPNDSPYGVVGWDISSRHVFVQEPEFDAINITLRIIREQGFVGDVAVQYSTKPNLLVLPVNQATANQDYIAQQGTTIIKENDTQALIRFTILSDSIPELHESFLVNISSVKVADTGPGRQPSLKLGSGMEFAEITIEENDNPRGIVQFNVTRDETGAVVAYEVAPPRNLLQLIVIRSSGTFGEISVAWEAQPGSANFSDFTPSYGSLTFPDGRFSTVLEIIIVDDNLTEFLETFTVSLTQVTGGAKMGDDIIATINIPNNDSPVGVFQFGEQSVRVGEPQTADDPAGLVSFTVGRDGGHGPVQIVWQVDDSAVDDLGPLAGTLSFNQTETKKTLNLRIYPDTLLEGEERYVIRLVSATNGAEISPMFESATIIILGDSASSGMIAIAESTKQILIGEPVGSYNGTGFITLVRGPAIFGEVIVNWIIIPGNLNEFVETSGTLLMRDKQSSATILIQAVDDDIPEEKQYYQLQLTGVSGGAMINDTSNSANITMAASDFPYGQFAFLNEHLKTFENGEQTNVTIVRYHGSLGSIHLWYQADNGTALHGLDFTFKSEQLVFEPGEQTKWISFNILDDNIPEGPEHFFINILKVELQSDSFHDFTVGDHGLKPDQPPALGNITSIRIVIQANDNAEGIIEIEPQFIHIEVEEDVGILGIPLIRKWGTYGFVTAEFASRAITATPNGVDYNLPNGTVTFYHGQKQAFINVTIIDDIESELEEEFEIQLMAVTGGAVLGTQLTTRVTIRKSDSIGGTIRFLNLTHLVIPNPNVTETLTLLLERTGGFSGDVQIIWNILGPNSEAVLPSSNTDISDPINGTFYFRDGETGNRVIELSVLPHEEIEMQETFIIQLILEFGEAEIDHKAGKVFLTVQKVGNPNGIVQFTEESLDMKTYLEPSSHEELLNIAFFITRTKGKIGNVKVHWLLQSDSDMTGDFLVINGTVTILDSQLNAEINVQLLADDVPELDEVYIMRLTSVEGGADLNEGKDNSRFLVPANDDPYGLFAVYSEGQTVIVESDLSRYFQINITRHGGTFQDVIVEYKLMFHGQDGFLGSVVVEDGAGFAVARVPISNQTFLGLDFNPSVELINVSVLSESPSIPPRLFTGNDSAIIFIPEEAANSEVGFESLVLEVSDVPTGACSATVSRNGVYGIVVVEWNSGYPHGNTPAGFTPGHIKPAFGSVVLSHGEKSKRVFLTVPTTNFTGVESFAVHLTAVHSNSSGKAELRSGFTVAEIEPLGVFQLASNSRQVHVEEDAGIITLHIQRLFGFQGNKTKLTYYTTAGSAKPTEDYEHIQNGELIFTSHQIEAFIKLFIINDNIPEMDEVFYLNLSSIEVLGFGPNNTALKTHLNLDFSVSSITIIANDATNGVLSIGPTVIHTVEDTENATVRVVFLNIQRTLGFTGIISVNVITFGEKKAADGLQESPFQNIQQNSTFSWAREGEDFEDETLNVTLWDEQREISVPIRIFDDNEPEGQEFFYVYLTDPRGGAKIVEGEDEYGYMAFMQIIISGNDIQNGIFSFTWVAPSNLVLDEDSEHRKLQLTIERQRNRSYEDVKILWRVTFNKSDVVLQRNGVDLVNELKAVTGSTLCVSGVIECTIVIEIKSDEIPESETWFLVEIYEVGAGAMINSSVRFLNITILESDMQHKLIFFAVGSRFPVIHQKATFVSLQVVREGGTNAVVSVSYQTQELRRAELVGQTSVMPAIAGMDFVKSEGSLTFQPGQSGVPLNIVLTPELASSNPLPKRFQVVLHNPTAGTQLDKDYNIANITIVTDANSQFFWSLIDQLYQPLDDDLINQILQKLQSKINIEATGEQLSAVMEVLEKVIEEGEKKPVSNTNRELFYNYLCALLDPTRKDTKGLSQLAEMTERFAFSLLTDIECGSPGERGKTILDTCQYLTIKSYHWYPQQINGHKVEGRNGDSLQIPERLLDVPLTSSITTGNESCQHVQFTEYSSQQWFQTSVKGIALSSKVFSASLKNWSSRPLGDSNEVIYQIHTADNRIVPHKSACLLWNQAAESWLSDKQFCRVVEDTSNYVECACSHMSIYTASAQTDSLSLYNEAFFAAAFICISGFALAILCHMLCSRFSMFAVKLLVHMMVACLGTQISFLMSIYLSRELSDESCSALGLVLHYFYLCQFSWMLIQSINFWQVLVMNDEHTYRRYLLFFILSWGLPAFVVALLVIILRGGYHWTMQEIYGTVYGDVCFIPNIYAALATAVLTPLLCLVGVFVIFIYVYQLIQQWKSYDDVFRGKANSTEVPLVLYLFALISLTWVWGGLHMAYRHFWMLILFVIFNTLQGLYVFVVYFILHNQLCWPVKASYNMEVNGHPSAGSAYLTPGSGAPSVGGEISKSTQNLITAMEEIPADWERVSLRPGSQASSIFKQSPQIGGIYATTGGYANTNLVADEESQEFDDLIFALKTGAGLNASDNESYHGSQDGGSIANSQIVELRRIPIADTHL
ncbi:adhesion G-protein coupled receptor V1 isoform X2 [Chiloscyllium plagiosum]|uniref:adhesion G-protein coupled receptor V1 isoform X2 n=1 Tax=Chiloscyllium plagiosum TaxID=36176 RepID=UPI001CB85721|nr:adhesion G-protein coupled receptor V1 isoform X2 [Chiloscyllium plagiosum]